MELVGIVAQEREVTVLEIKCGSWSLFWVVLTQIFELYLLKEYFTEGFYVVILIRLIHENQKINTKFFKNMCFVS